MVQRDEAKRRASVEGKSAGLGPGPHTEGLWDLPCHLITFHTGMEGRGACSTGHSVPAPVAEGSYTSPYTAQET